ncbi:MAG: sugar phosphate isomerase/epimerase [Planctomycetes bacterium]|nr:sugar phosphate isomerase/epimerase [Planctomycetota bacterium]
MEINMSAINKGERSTNVSAYTRRGFLKVVGAGVAAGITAPILPTWARKTGRKKWRMRLSTSSIHFMQLPIEQACERIAKLGFEAIDIWSAHEGCPHLDDAAKRLGAKGLKKLLSKHKLKLFAFSVYQGGYERYAELLGKTGGGVAIRGSAGPCKPEELTGRMRQFIERLKPLDELAEKYNSYLAIENHGNALLSSLDSLKAFVDINTSRRLGIALAPYHIQTLKASVPDAIRICGKQLLFFYAWQHSGGSKQLPGIGPTDMTPWIQALADIRYRGYVNPFMHGHPEANVMTANLANSRDYLKNCYKKVNQTTDL